MENQCAICALIEIGANSIQTDFILEAYEIFYSFLCAIIPLFMPEI